MKAITLVAAALVSHPLSAQAPTRAEATVERVEIAAPNGFKLAGRFRDAGGGAPGVLLFPMCSPTGPDGWTPVAERLRAGEFDDGRPPARLHGDLWAGNVIFTGTGVVLIDPAAHGGHGLTDLAMLHLFGAPELPTITDAYAEAAALPTGWRELIGLHQLHPLLVHAVTHGPSYGAEAEAVAARYA